MIYERVPALLMLIVFSFLAVFVLTSSKASASAPTLHYRSPTGWIGDIHALYIDGVWNLYYLEVPREPDRDGLAGVHQKRLVSVDLVNWEPAPIANVDGRPWWAIANLLVDGKIFSLHNNVQRNDGYDLNISKDGEKWVPLDQNPVLPYARVPGEPRDPAFFQLSDSEYMLILAVKQRNNSAMRHFGTLPDVYSGSLYYSLSSDLRTWSELKPLYQPGNLNVPEVPDLFQLGDKYYLIASWGTDRVGTAKYRIGDSPIGPWQRPYIDQLDGTELMASTTAGNEERRILFGWIPTYRDRKDYGEWEWGGDLAFPREIYRDGDGNLYTKLPDEFKSLRKDILYPTDGPLVDFQMGDWQIDGSTFVHQAGGDYGELWLKGNFANFEMTATIVLDEDTTNAGFLFRAGNPFFAGYEVSIDMQQQMMHLRTHLERRRTLVSRPIRIEPNTPHELRIFVDGDIVEIFLDDKYSMVGRAQTTNVLQHKVGFYVDRGYFKVEDTTIYSF